MKWSMEKTRHRIAHVITESEPFGGAQRNTLLTLKGLLKDGYDTELICGSGGPLIQEARACGVPVHVIPSLIRQIDPLRDCYALLQLYRVLRARQYRIVHTHSNKAGVLGRLAAQWAGVPRIIHTFHSVPPFELNGDLRSKLYIALERYLGVATVKLICVGEILRQEILTWNIAPEEKVITIYSGIDFLSYVPQRARLETKRLLDLEKAWPIVGCIGRLSEQKSQQHLVQSLAFLKKKYPRIQLLLVGEGDLRTLLEEQAQTLGVSSHISLLGERADIADLLNIFDVYAMSSRWEGVGRALTEAMYSALPIVATPVNGVKELIIHEETGLLVPPCEPRALADAIDRLSIDPDLAKRLGSNAQRKVIKLMGAQQMISAIEELYERLKDSTTNEPFVDVENINAKATKPQAKSLWR
jgi:glycosyltransferase involved in cell wall biosynthesis